MCDVPSSLSRPRRILRPWLTSLLEHRPLSACLGISGAAQIALTAAHVGGMPCPFFQLTGIPCPGCGVSRACVHLLAGREATAMHLHAFSPLFLLAVGLFLAAGLLPGRIARRLVVAVATVETKTALPSLLLGAAIVYWLTRLGYDPVALAHLMRG